MARSPIFKIYAGREYIAACKDPLDALAICVMRGDGSTIRYNHKTTIWNQGAERVHPAESYDEALDVIFDRVDAIEAPFARYAVSRPDRVEAGNWNPEPRAVVVYWPDLDKTEFFNVYGPKCAEVLAGALLNHLRGRGGLDNASRNFSVRYYGPAGPRVLAGVAFEAVTRRSNDGGDPYGADDPLKF